MRRFVIKSCSDFEKFLKVFNKRQFSLDTETTSLKYLDLKIEGFSLCDGKISCYVYLADYSKDSRCNEFINYINPERIELLLILKNLCDNAETIIMHNAPYDMKVLYKYGILINKEPMIYDTMVGHHLINEEDRCGLKYLAEEILGVETTKYTDIQDHSSKEFFRYAIYDAEWTFMLMQYQVPILKKDGSMELYRRIESPFQYVLRDMEINGVLVDKEEVKRQEAKCIPMMKECTDIMYEIVKQYGFDDNFNFNSAPQLRELVFGKFGLQPINFTPNNAPKIGKDELPILEKQDSTGFITALMKYKKVKKLHSSYLSSNGQILRNIDKDNKVRPNIRDTGAETGRMSCTNPNLQQLPNYNEKIPISVRSCFVAGKGYKMFTCDFSNQEGRITAHITNDDVYIKQLLNGWDSHLSTANASFDLGIPEEYLSDTHPKHSEIKSKYAKMRKKAKPISFMMPYRCSKFGLSKALNCSTDEAQEIIDKYYEKYSGIKHAMDECDREIEDTGVLTNMFGRKRHFKKEENRYTGKLEYPPKVYRQALNFKIQSSSADMMRKALVEVREEYKKHPEWDAKLLMTIHDEAVATAKEGYAQEAGNCMKKVFESCLNLVVPIKSDLSIGDNYEEAK